LAQRTVTDGVVLDDQEDPTRSGTSAHAAFRAVTLGPLVDGIGVLGTALRMLDVLSVGVVAVMRALEVVGLLRI
jgi:hypothetical protein